MRNRVINTPADHAATLKRIELILGAKLGTPKADELDLLATLVELYEDREMPMPSPSALDAIRFRMEQQGLRAKDLVPYIGSASKVSEVLSGKRALSLTMIRNLVDGLGIPAEILLTKPRSNSRSRALILPRQRTIHSRHARTA